MTEQPEDAEIVRDEPADGDPLVSEQENAAAAEAARIGGPVPDPEIDPADRPVQEAGGGEAEGFELAEDALRRQASHEDSGRSPTQDAFTAEEESALSGAEYGEPDEAGLRDDGAA